LNQRNDRHHCRLGNEVQVVDEVSGKELADDGGSRAKTDAEAQAN
jgi:hypothetical protein